MKRTKRALLVGSLALAVSAGAGLLISRAKSAATARQARADTEVRPYKIAAGADAMVQAKAALAQTSGRIALAGLERPVEVIRDRWGVPHIYAETVHDLFFAQGFVAAQDRLWQMEIWRRNGEGRLAEVLGEGALPRDVQARLMRYRGDMQAEWASYAPDARQVITSFVAGVNAFIEHATKSDRLPVEFNMMGFQPEPWTPEVCLTRMAGYIMTRNLNTEVLLVEMTQRVGPENAMQLFQPDPNTKIRPEPGVKFGDIAPSASRILAGHRAATGAIAFQSGVPLDSQGSNRGSAASSAGLWPARAEGGRDARATNQGRQDAGATGSVPLDSQGSNNWTVHGSHTGSGRPMLANDPHRQLMLPSLRYMVHLVGPGWNVIGAGEPALPAVAIGHNERVAYGVTIFGADQQDLYVEKTDPGNPLRYLYRGTWETMRTVKESFRVKGKAEPLVVELRFTRHGPVIYEDRQRRLAYALRWSGSEPGGAGYLASLSLIRARNWDEFQKALERWKIPPLNMVYADVDGNIGYQVAGLIPARQRWNGLVPVPGDSGLYEWRGFRRLAELPRAFNPSTGFAATANHNTLPLGDRRIPPPGYEWAPPFRYRRIEQVLGARRDFTIADMERLQHDETSLPAQQLVAMLDGADSDQARVRDALGLLRRWDKVLSADSGAAALYELWARKLVPKVLQPLAPADLWPRYSQRASLAIAIALLQRAPAHLQRTPQERHAVLLEALREADADVSRLLGSDMKKWRWSDLHKAEFRHPLAGEFSLAPVARGGDGFTVNNTSFAASSYRQTSGASYRQIFDVGEWDNSVAINVPGQSGQPGSPHYSDLLPLWAAGRYHPLPFSRKAVQQHAAQRLLLEPHSPR